jgi:hypothetical protein
MPDYTPTSDLDRLLAAARNASAALDGMIQRRQRVEEEVYNARCDLGMLVSSLETMVRQRDRKRRFGRV